MIMCINRRFITQNNQLGPQARKTEKLRGLNVENKT
jgi:hypothetical protein